jgi:hypothetical protein
MKNLIFTETEFLSLFDLPEVTYEQFCDQISVLNVMDRSGSFVIRSNLNDFVNRVSKKDDRKARLEVYKQQLYRILVTDAEKTLREWFHRYGSLKENLDWYLNLPARI